MDENMECPICKKKVVFVGVHDDEGNYHGPVGCEYENDPWSGLSYALHHEGWGIARCVLTGHTALWAECSLIQPRKQSTLSPRRTSR